MIKIFCEKKFSDIKNEYYNEVCLDKKGKRKTIKGLISIIKEIRAREIRGMAIEFYNELLSDIELTNDNSLILDSPVVLEDKRLLYQRKYKGIFTKKFLDFLLDDCFFYGSYEKWGAYKLAENLKVSTCPYCNRQYTFTLDTENGKTRPEYDHFYDKATYPYLSMCLFNLIPSCSICNSSLKGSTKFTIKTHINPYLEGFSKDIKFSIRPRNIEFVDGKSSSYIIKFKVNKRITTRKKMLRAGGNMRVFKLVELYNMHKDYVDELIIKSRIYNKEYIESLFIQFDGEFFSDINDVKRLITSNYVNEPDYGKRVLSKLTADISEELGLI